MKKPYNSLVEIPEPPSAEARKVAMALVGLLPGASMIQLFADKAWPNPSERALRDFVMDLALRIAELEQTEGLDFAEILERPQTRPLLVRAIDAASKSIGETKFEALRNAASQGIFERGYSFDLSVMVFALLDRLTEGHLKILKAVDSYARKHGGLAWPSRSQLAISDVPTLANPVGMREPKDQSFDQGGFIDDYLIRINKMLIDDLINMDLLHLVGGQPTGIVAASANGFDNIPYTVQFTDKGELVFEHIFPPQGSVTGV